MRKEDIKRLEAFEMWIWRRMERISWMEHRTKWRDTSKGGFIHSFIPDIYIAPLQETYSKALLVKLRSKRNVLRSLQKEDMLF